MDYEKLGLFYLGRHVNGETQRERDEPVLYDAQHLVTHAVILGMTGSGKTGLGIGLIEEAAIDSIPVLAIDPKGDLSNLLLTFPDLRVEDFASWVNPDEARVQGQSVGAFAEREAARWREGLSASGQDGARIARLRAAADFAVYTPGSRAARPVSVLRTFQVPPPVIVDDPELLAERASSSATSLLTLAGIDTEPLRSREHILLSTLLTEAWRQGRSLDLPAIIASIQSPPIQKIGVLELDTFFPAAERFKLALDLNRILAAPDFAVWLEGDLLDIDSLLYTRTGKPRVTVLSIAHLDDRERMFVVSLVLNELVSWMRAQRGTSSLRALVYIDEMTGFLPPVANPPSKTPLMILLKQARAFGLGMTLATQNPVDLDYKALSNAGTWLLGRLQTERDKARLLDGLESAQAAAGHGFDRPTIDRMLSSLQKRTFLLHNVHAPAPLLFRTRWTLSYLRGPLGREELARLPGNSGPTSDRADETLTTPADGRSAASAASAASATSAASSGPTTSLASGASIAAGASSASGAPVGSGASFTPAASGAAGLPPVLDPAIPQFFAPGSGPVWTPMLLGAARIAYSDAKIRLNDMRDIVVLTPLGTGAVAADWEHAEPAAFSLDDLSREPDVPRAFAALPPAAVSPKKYAQWSKEFAQWVARAQSIELWRSARARMVSHPDESERDFRIRLQTSLREARDAEMTKVRDRYGPKLAALNERVRRAEAAVRREEQQASESKMQAGVSMAATIFGALLGRKAVSASTLGRATTTARGMGRIGREAQDVERATAELAALRTRHDDLERELESELQAITVEWEARDEPLERLVVKPKRGGTTIQLVALVWVPRS